MTSYKGGRLHSAVGLMKQINCISLFGLQSGKNFALTHGQFESSDLKDLYYFEIGQACLYIYKLHINM